MAVSFFPFFFSCSRLCLNTNPHSSLTTTRTATTTDEESYEPFDQSLAAKVQSLAEQVEELTADVAAARSTVPARAAEAFVAGYLAADAENAADVADVAEDADDGDETRTDELDDIREFGATFSDPKMRWQDMSVTWQRAADELVRLNGFSETFGRVKRARGVVGEAGRVAAGG